MYISWAILFNKTLQTNTSLYYSKWANESDYDLIIKDIVPVTNK